MVQESVSRQYVSIVRLLEHIGVDAKQLGDISRVKKQITAEFNFAKDGFIEVDGHTYNKDEVLRELESPDFDTRLSYHLKLWHCKAILQMLEKNEADWKAISTEFKQLEGDTSFDEFFSPYFAQSFNNLSRNYITAVDYPRLTKLLQYRDFILPLQHEQAYKSIRSFLEESIRTLKNVSTDNYKVLRPKLEAWLQPGWHYVLNNLPEEYFEYVDDMVHLLINTTVKIQHIAKYDCRIISTELVGLIGINPEYKSIIDENHSIFSGQKTRLTNSRNKTSEGGQSYWWILWVIFVIIRIATRGGCN
jgi:hypothetical protein